MNLALITHAGSPLQWFMLLVLGVAVGLLGGKWLRQNRRRSPIKSPRTLSPSIPSEKTLETDYSEAAYYDIEPLTDFDYEKEEPLKIRPFKPKYHLTMALENTALSDLIAMDNTYLSRLAIRRQLIQAERRETIACTPEAEPAVKELYEWLIGTYLPRRFPTIYTLVNPNSNTTGKDEATHLKNHATNILIPLTVADPDLALQILGENIDTEFLLLQKHPSSSSSPSEQPPYRLTAFINCFPAGFSTLSKLGLSLAAIHSPIPHYSEKLEKSMDRYFASLPVGKIVKRVNWGINTTPELFCLGGTHMSEEQHQQQQEKEEEVDIEKTVLRCERQTLHRLPKTGALVFAFKTYTYPLDAIRAEGNAEALAQATKGLGLGSVPRMTVYKREVVWGDKVRAFLRGVKCD